MKVYLLFFSLLFSSLLAQAQEHLILCGGPALLRWEKLRVDQDRHDRFWGNFIRASTIRIDELRRAYGQNAKVVWVVYQPGYVARGREDGNPYTKWIQDQATKRNVQLIWVQNGDQAIRAMNARPSGSVVTFDFFGHSNKHALFLDYSSEVSGACAHVIHERDLSKIRRGIFSKNVLSQSYGCHTGESMSQIWRQTLGHTLIGAHGKTDYRSITNGQLPYIIGRWVR